MSIGLVSTITPSSSNDSHLSGSSSGSTKPRHLQAGEADRRDQIIHLLYEALWKKGEQAWNRISRVPNPDVTPGEAQEDSDDTRGEVQVTLVDLTTLLKWTTSDEKLRLMTYKFLVRDEYTEFDAYLETHDDHVLLMGQPGIGS